MNTTPMALAPSNTYADTVSAELRDQYGIDTDDDLDRLRRVRDYLVAACVQSEWLNMRLTTYEEFFAPVLELIEELDEVLDTLESEAMYTADDGKDADDLPSRA